jgi:hypothetical protein
VYQAVLEMTVPPAFFARLLFFAVSHFEDYAKRRLFVDFGLPSDCQREIATLAPNSKGIEKESVRVRVHIL